MSVNTIKLKSMSPDIMEESEVNEVLYPGHLVEDNANSKLQKHGSAGDTAIPRFALETGFMGKGIEDPFDPSGEITRASTWFPKRGEWVYAVLKDGENVSRGDKLESAGDGTLQEHGTESVGITGQPVVGEALEDLDLSGSSGEESSGTLGYNKRIKIRVA